MYFDDILIPCLTSIYRQFISHFNSIVTPLTECMKVSKFAWTNEANAAFLMMKKPLTAIPILALPHLTHIFELQTDDSMVGKGAV